MRQTTLRVSSRSNRAMSRHMTNRLCQKTHSTLATLDELAKLANYSLMDTLNADPAAQRAEALKTKFAFKTEMDEDASKKLFPSNERLKAAGA